MNKQDFITVLRQNLAGMDDYEFVNDTVNYYEDYIETRVRKGEQESVILAELGEPRLIAKSIKMSRSEVARTQNEEPDISSGTSAGDMGGKLFKGLNVLAGLPMWLKNIIAVVGIGLLLVVVFTVLQWLFPVLVVGGVAYIFYKFFKDNFGK